MPKIEEAAAPLGFDVKKNNYKVCKIYTLTFTNNWLGKYKRLIFCIWQHAELTDELLTLFTDIVEVNISFLIT